MPQVPETVHIGERIGLTFTLNAAHDGFTVGPRERVQDWIIRHCKRNKPEIVAYLLQEHKREWSGNGVRPDDKVTCDTCGKLSDYVDPALRSTCLDCLWPTVNTSRLADTLRRLDPSPERIGGDTSTKAPVELKAGRNKYLPNVPKKPLPKPKMDGSRPLFGGFS